MKENKITIHGPKTDGTYIVEFKTADGLGLAFSVPKGGRDCHPGVLPRQDALRARGAGCPTDPFAGLFLARAPRSEQYRVTLRASCGRSAPTALPSVK